MPGISRDPEKARRQLAGLASTNSRLAARLDAGELPGFKGPLEGTEHLHPEAAAAVTPPAAPPVPDAGHVPGTSPASEPSPAPAGHVPGTSRAPIAEVGSYQEPAPDATDPELEPPADHGPAEPGPAGEPADPPPPVEQPRRGAFGQLADGFLGRL